MEPSADKADSTVFMLTDNLPQWFLNKCFLFTAVDIRKEHKIASIWCLFMAQSGAASLLRFATQANAPFILKIETPHVDGDCTEVAWPDSSMGDGPRSFITPPKPDVTPFVSESVNGWKSQLKTQETASQEKQFPSPPALLFKDINGPPWETKFKKGSKCCLTYTKF